MKLIMAIGNCRKPRRGTVRRRLSHDRRSATLFLFGCFLACAAAGQPGFTDRTEAAGVTFLHQPPHVDGPAAMFGGGTVGDFNGDGWPDFLVIGGGLRPDALFINNRDGTFTDMAAAAGLNDLYRGGGASAVDYDRDGDVDIFVTSFGDMDGEVRNGQHRLYRNNGDGTFSEVADDAGVNDTGPRPNGMGSAWGDYDLDGDLDLYVSGWGVNFGSIGGNRLFRSQLTETGQAVFIDVSEELGLFEAPTRAFGGIFVDMNHDRYPELLVTGDFGTSAYYANLRDGTFKHLTGLLRKNGEKVYNGMGATIGDFDRDGNPDWFLTAAYPAWHDKGSPGNFLYRNRSVSHEHDVVALPESAGVSDGGFGWGVAANDFDHDGWTDIVMTDGWDCPDPVTGECFTNEPAYLFRNLGGLDFVDVAQNWGLDHRKQGRALLTFDYDRDGDMDIVMLSNPVEGEGDPPGNGELRLYRNELSGIDRHWIEIVLDSSPNPALAPHGLGSVVKTRAGGLIQSAVMHGGSNYLGRSQLVAHFGLAEKTILDEIEILWTDGFRVRLTDVTADQILTVSAPLPLTAEPLRPGQPADLVVMGLEPGEAAFFAANLAGPGDGPCPPQLGGLCSGLAAPSWPLGSATADALGTAILTITVPLVPAGTSVFTQALISRGEGGILSLKTNISEGIVESLQSVR